MTWTSPSSRPARPAFRSCWSSAIAPMAARATRMSTSSSAPASARRRLEGVAALERALDAGLPVRCVVVPEGPLPAELAALCDRAAAAGAEIVRGAERRHERLAGELAVAALVGPERDADLDTVMARGGAVWLIAGARYAGNVGTAIRTAEVSGADGVYIDNDFDHDQRREARRASMRADRFLPVAWERAGDVIGAARRAGKRIVGIEDSGRAAPWEIDLTPPVLFIAGGEADGVPRAARALRRRGAHPDGGLRRLVQPAGRGGDPRRRTAAPTRRIAMRQDTDALTMLPLYFSARRSARVLGVVFVLAAAISWLAAGYDLG